MHGPLLTYQDAYEHLLDVYDLSGKAVGVQDRRLRRAIGEAYRLLPSFHDWEYFRGTTYVVTTAPESHPGTYTASTRRIVISSGTWTEHATAGAVVVNNIRYPVSRRIDDTTIELEYGPESDTTDTFRWQRFKYLLPLDVGEISQIVDPNQYAEATRVPPEELFWWQEAINTEIYPLAWSLFPSSQYAGRLELWLSGSGEISRTLKIQYRIRHTGVSITELNTGTVSVTGDVATFSESVLTSSAIGAVLRISSDGNTPTSQYGRLERNTNTGEQTVVLRPAEYETRITTINSATEAVISSSLSASPITTKGYSISSHINVNYEGMWEFFLRLAEERYDILRRADTAIRNISFHARQEALRAAMAADGPGQSRDSHVRFRADIILEDG